MGTLLASIPPQTWLALVGVPIALPSALYVIRYLSQARSRQDITQPPEDLSWRSGPKFLASIFVVAGMAAVLIFAFTPAAERLAKSSLMIPTILAGVGSVILKIVFDAWRKGVAVPLVAGFSREFDSETAPRRYWGSMAWNSTLGLTLLFAAPQGWQDAREEPCFLSGDDGGSPKDGIDACNLALVDGSSSSSRRALILRHRGDWHARSGENEAALADYDRSLELDNSKPETFHQRGLLHQTINRPYLAWEDFNSVLNLDPDHVDALASRGNIKFNDGYLEGAADDFDRAIKLRPPDAWLLASRAYAYAGLKRLDEAERDLAAAERLDPDSLSAARGRIVVSVVRGDIADARRRLQKILADDKDDDGWARGMLDRLRRQSGE